MVGVDRRREPADRTRAIPYTQLQRLWRREDIAIREKALWRLLYETAARAARCFSPIAARRRAAPPRSSTSARTSGHARLSYRRAEEIFRAASGAWTLHQLRHSAITHLAEDNVALPMLMAKSRHTSLRSLQMYARPSADAVAALTAAHDPERRRR